MPAYGSAKPVGIYLGDLVTLFSAEATPTKSVAVAVPPSPVGSTPQYAVQLHFASAPTSFTFNIEGANDDVDGHYATVTPAANTIPTGTATDYEVSFTSNSMFLRANLSAQSGGGNVTSSLRRIA